MLQKTHLAELDALRGLAAVIVVVSHCANKDLLPGPLGEGFGQMGVGLFYVLSAFLLTSLYADRRLDRGAMQDYLVRRGARVLPLYYAVLFASLTLLLATGLSVYEAFASPATVLGNSLLIQGTSVLWSIPVEIQFYLVFLGFWSLRRSNGIPAALGYLLVVQGLLGALALLLDFSRYSLPYWMHFFTIGCALALVAGEPGLRARLRDAGLVRLGCLAAVLGTAVVMPGVRRDILGLPTMPVFADPLVLGWVVAMSAAFVLCLVPKALVETRLARSLGELSFSIYLLHMAVLVIVTELWVEDLFVPFDRFVIVVSVTWLLARVANRGLERPAQKWLLRQMLAPQPRVGA